MFYLLYLKAFSCSFVGYERGQKTLQVCEMAEASCVVILWPRRGGVIATHTTLTDHSRTPG